MAEAPTAPAIVEAAVSQLELDNLNKGEIHRLAVKLVTNELGQPMHLPVLVAKGVDEGPIVGLTAAVHGNELNGIPVIHRLVHGLDPDEMQGTIVAVPVVNIPGYRQKRREFSDGSDLNRLMPGKPAGTEAEAYAASFVNAVVRPLDYLIDLHTASFGRVNSLYVRADMREDVTAKMARLVGAQIIVHNEGADGTLRSAADDLGIHAITVEVGDPNRFQRGLIRTSRSGINAILQELGVLPSSEGDPEDEQQVEDEEETVECSRSYWMYTHAGGVLEVFPPVGRIIKEGALIARIRSIYGDVVDEYRAPEDGIVVAKSISPVASTGARILHLGVIA